MSRDEKPGSGELALFLLGLGLVLVVTLPAAVSSLRLLERSPAVPGTIDLRTIDLNAADAATLETLPGIGPALARRIADDRLARGPFRAIGDIDRVRGIGPATLRRLTPYVFVK